MSDTIETPRQREERYKREKEEELERRRNEIYKILDESKQFAKDCDTLIGLRGMRIRCEKLTRPRHNPYPAKKNSVKS